uniref:Cytohesin Ubiquitin Protein Inducing domain-containing protein n=1 Tax=Panagrolaimus superbus TaxID=310955 RepID=A0A914YT48_9BILA
MPSAKIFDQNPSMQAAQAGMSSGIPVVINPLKHPLSKRNDEKTEEEKQRDQKRAEELTKLRDSVEDALIQKLDDLKKICIEEAEITGVLPVETYITLHPDEPLPKIKRRVGTTFSIPDDVFANSGTDDKVVLMETDIRMQKEIIAATERMSKDKYINKSLRKKHRRDLQSAHHKLRNLQKGLNRMRLSMSKPDVSNIENSEGGSGISRIKNWSWSSKNQEFSMAKSCPTTPRGSIPDLCDSDERSSNCSRVFNKSPAPSSSSMGQLRPPTTSTTSATSITTNASPNDSGIHSETTPPLIPNRRMTLPATSPTSPKSRNQITKSIDAEGVHIYENVGYTSMAPYKSAYRQSNFPTLQTPDGMSEPNLRSLLTNDSTPQAMKGSSSTQFTKSTNNATNFGVTNTHFPYSTQENITSAANTQLGRIVRKMSNGVSTAAFLSQTQLPSHRLSMANPTTVRASSSVHGGGGSGINGGFSTASLDRRALRQRQAAAIAAANTKANENSKVSSHMLTTTFPVGVETFNQSQADRLRSISQHNGIGIGIPHCTVNPRHHSTSRLPPGEWPYPSRDPQMEALLNFYRGGVFSKKLAPSSTVSSTTPTTRIVPIQQKSSSSSNSHSNSKGATMV